MSAETDRGAGSKPTATDGQEPAPLAHASQATLDIEPSDESGPAPDLPDIQPSRTVGHLAVIQPGRYRVTAELGRGGLGRVSEAEDRRLGREVALKELLDASADPGRFLREALITARLQHPGIVPVYEAGYWPDGAPFYAMKRISGDTLAQRILMARTLAERLAYLPNMIAAVHAVAYAHEQGVIHRDIKPSNLILGDFGETVVVDWGLAKYLDEAKDRSDGLAENRTVSARVEPRAGHDPLTRAGAVLGTPAYMAPEQIASGDVDERADIYALGATLYHLLAGRPPYRGTAPEILERARAAPPEPLAELAPEIPPDLAAIVARAMMRAPSARYASARELAEELTRFQNGQLVRAHDYSALMLVRRWIGRHRALVLVTSVLVAALALTAVFSVRRIVEERDRAYARQLDAERASAREQERSDQLTLAQAAGEHDPTAAIAWLATLSPRARLWPGARVVATRARNLGVARHVWRDHEGSLTAVALSPDRRYLALGTQAGELLVRDLGRGDVHRLSGHSSWIHALAFVEIGATGEPRLLSASRDGVVRAWPFPWASATREPAAELRGPGEDSAVAGFSPDRRYLATGHASGHVRVFDTRSRTSRELAGAQARISNVAFSPDGDWLVATDIHGAVFRWRMSEPAATGEAAAVLARAHTEQIWDLALSGDSARFATAGADGTARVWAMDSGQLLGTYEHGAAVYKVQFLASAAGALELASAASDGAVRVWSLADGRARVLGYHEDGAYALARSDDHRWLASGGGDGNVKVWDLASHSLHRVYTGPPDVVTELHFAADAGTLWSIGHASGVREWHLIDETRRVLHGPRRQVNAIAISADDRYAASGHSLGAVMLWELGTGEGQIVAEHHGSVVGALAFSPDDRFLVSASHDGALRVYDRETREARLLGRHEDMVTDLAIAPDSRRVATSGLDQRIGLWDLRHGHLAWLRGHEDRVRRVAFSADGATLVSASRDGSIRAWQPDAGTSRVLGHHPGGATALAFSPDGARLASAGQDRHIALWTLDGRGERISTAEPFPADELIFSPDGRRLAAFGRSGDAIRIYDRQQRAWRSLPAHNPRSAAWSPDSARLAVLAEDATVRLWDVRSGQGHVLTRLPAPANQIAYAHGGGLLLFGDRQERVHLWFDDLPAERDPLRAWLTRATTAVIAPDRVLATPAR